MLSKELERTLTEAFQTASQMQHEFMTAEHLLLALLNNNTASNILLSVECDIEKLRHHLTIYLDKISPILTNDSHLKTQPTLGFQRILQRAIFHVQSSSKKEVTGANVLVAIFGEQESHAIYLLSEQNITRLNIINYLSHGIIDPDTKYDNNEDTVEMGEEGQEKTFSPLEQYTENLIIRAQKGHIDPLIGRDDEIKRTIQILCRRRKNNPLLVGEAGVGKTAIAEGLAKRIVDGEVPQILNNTVIYSLDLGSLIAGTKYRGDFEKRLKSVLSELKKCDDAVLFIDEIHTIIGAGSTSGGVMDISNLLKPVLSSGELKCIGSTTYQEFRGIFEKDQALTRRFQKIDVPEPSVDETYEILKGLVIHFEEHHNVHYTLTALKAAAELSARYINDRHLPDKAIDVIDEAGSQHRLKNISNKNISIHDIEGIVASIAKIPPKQVSSNDQDILRHLDDNLKMVVYGQDDAIDELSTAIKLARSGLREGEKPIGSFLFAGPTGVGKTEITRQLAMALGIELIRFDMSEYMERHTISRLIGAPPGYVGYDQGGLLTESVNKSPHCVLLLDEIEKAHPDVFNLLLQVMDHGTLTDNNGRKVDFRNVILIMTTNVGADLLHRATMGFTQQDHSTDGIESIKKLFTPEFRNRLDNVVQFKPLNRRIVASVVDKFIIQLEAQLEDKRVTLKIDEPARTWLAEKGYDEKMGARFMARTIQNHIKNPLANELLFGKLAKGGHVQIMVKNAGLIFDITKAKSKKAVQ